MVATRSIRKSEHVSGSGMMAEASTVRIISMVEPNECIWMIVRKRFTNNWLFHLITALLEVSYLSQNLHNLHYLHRQAREHAVRVLVKVLVITKKPSLVFTLGSERCEGSEGFQNDMKVGK